MKHTSDLTSPSSAGCSLKEQVDQVPCDPGCYLWKGANGSILYVGKAKNLRARMRQYILGEDERPMVPLMMGEVESFDYIVTSTEHEALVLELNLIQQHHPPFNVNLRDDKSYPYLALTQGDLYPALKYTRERHRPETLYFGPYTDARAARQLLDTVRRVVPLCAASCAEWRRAKRVTENMARSEAQAALAAEELRPCFDSHVGRGPGVCCGAISPDEYATHVEQVRHFLSGHKQEFVAELTQEMSEAAADLDFERAARLKRRLETIETLDSRQQVMFPSAWDLDAIGFWREETIAAACVFLVREGRVIRTCDFILDKGLDVGEEELVSGFVKRYYDQTSDVPLEVDVPALPEDASSLASWLSAKRTRKVVFHVPKQREKAHLQDMATTNARHALSRYKIRSGYDDKRTNQALLQLESALALDGPPMRIECFDISTIHGKHTVASMVVFSAGQADKSQYRHFKIRMPLEESNDVASMREALSRRFAPERVADERFGSLPDLLIVDGGKPQLNVAQSVLADLGVHVAIAGLAKSDEELFVTWSENAVVLPMGSASLYLVKQVRDEAHRFAITYHRKLRDKAMTISMLDEIEGIGPVRKKAIRKAFPSMKKLRAATYEELCAVRGLPADVARELFETLRAWEQELTR